MRHHLIHIIARTLCECDGKDWMHLVPCDRERYTRIAILIDYRVSEAEADRCTDRVPTAPEDQSSAVEPR